MKKGFTLIELLIVLVIIGIIIGLILPNTLRAIQKANERECGSNIRAINTAIQLCYTSTRDWAVCQTAADLTAPNPNGGKPYLDVFPVCPFSVAYTIVPASGPNGAYVDGTEHFANWPQLVGDHK